MELVDLDGQELSNAYLVAKIGVDTTKNEVNNVFFGTTYAFIETPCLRSQRNRRSFLIEKSTRLADSPHIFNKHPVRSSGAACWATKICATVEIDKTYFSP